MRCQPKAVLACNDRQRHRTETPTDVQNMAFCPTKGHLLRCKRASFARKTWPFGNTLTSRKIETERETAPSHLPEGRGVDEKAAPPNLPKGRGMVKRLMS